MFTIFDFEIGEVTTRVLGGKRPLLHVDVPSLLLLFRIGIIAASVTTVLIIEATIGGVV